MKHSLHNTYIRQFIWPPVQKEKSLRLRRTEFHVTAHQRRRRLRRTYTDCP